MALIFAKQIKRGETFVYGEYCLEDGASVVSVPEDDFNKALTGAIRVVCWGGVDGGNVLDLQALFATRHSFLPSLLSFGPFKSAVHVEQLRELWEKLRRNGRLRWQTRNGQSRLWYDPEFHLIAS